MFLNRGLAFQAKCWPKANIVVTKLKQIHRQGEDKELVEALESLRKGKMTKQLDKIVRECGRKLPEIVHGYGVVIKPTKLFTKIIICIFSRDTKMRIKLVLLGALDPEKPADQQDPTASYNPRIARA